MSTVTLTTGVTGQIYGTFPDAVNYLGALFGDQYTAWQALSVDDQKRTLISASRYLDRLTYAEGYEDFAARDAEAWDDGTLPFPYASYELAALAADDPEVLGGTSGGTIQRVYAGGAGVDFAQPISSDADESGLPDVLDQLIGEYLAGMDIDLSADGGSGVSGSCENPFGPRTDYGRNGPY